MNKYIGIATTTAAIVILMAALYPRSTWVPRPDATRDQPNGQTHAAQSSTDDSMPTDSGSSVSATRTTSGAPDRTTQGTWHMVFAKAATGTSISYFGDRSDEGYFQIVGKQVRIRYYCNAPDAQSKNEALFAGYIDAVGTISFDDMFAVNQPCGHSYETSYRNIPAGTYFTIIIVTAPREDYSVSVDDYY
jgi:hypothetical protein